MKPLHEQDDIPDLLRQLRANGDGYRKPDHQYFDQLSEQVLADERSVRSINSGGRSKRWTLGLAAAAMISLLAIFTFLRPSFGTGVATENDEAIAATTSWEAQINELDATEIQDYIDINIQDFDLDLLAEDFGEQY